ncbi:MAG: NACHT domain-containing NTPase [Hydrococcus sp. C42_A2020_068]|uniref:NACHT domain-containing protein n=1 Tax=Pleurocapsa sp. PCC 7327 TaxID=118163 RepID=UPI00029F8438|nr:NACHT domain-containing NTPase [Pleurocapsa sp. PCC 7327]AFY76955.1 putative NTPase (NACHT family) [Pleurocapsa sp. PCC 7327]MBF2019499.1 NACHT domain-containing NTPase [Hydrococcus sp. C42_A2020_068]
MAKRSLRSSTTGIVRAKQAFESQGWTQESLATEVGLSSRQSIWKFFTGRPIERHIFKEICFKLDLDWTEIADLPKEQLPVSQPPEIEENLGIEEWVQRMRSRNREHIQTQCDTLQSSFDLTQPLLSQIYTLVNLLPHPSSQRWLEISDLQNVQPELARLDFTQLDRSATPGMELVAQHNKLMILGKPGSGKTTFLQYIALQCNQGKYKRDLIPFFIQLRILTAEVPDEEDFSFLNYIVRQCQACGLSKHQALILLQEGKILLLLDGLDEIPESDSNAILKQIDIFSQEYYKNHIIITCRTAAVNYHFRGFTYVEIADFKQDQIETFAKKWFIATANSEREGILKAEQFLEQLERPENQPIRELGITPILLNLICSVFKERASFPTKRSKLYQAGLDILLQRWDRARGIHRDRVYQHLSLPDKIKLLCQIAATTFEQENYFFESSEILPIIEDYLRHLPNSTTDPETLWLDSEAVLKAIELQHGLLVERARDIYSFSHLTFQEYLTARKIVASPAPQKLEQELQKLASHTTENRWREVTFLTVGMLPQADFLLQKMKENVDACQGTDRQLQEFLTIIARKVSAMQLPYLRSAVRAFYFTLFQSRDLNLAVSLDDNLVSMKNLPMEMTLDTTIARAFTDSLNLVQNPDLKKFINLCFTLDLESKFQLETSFKQALRELKKQLPEPNQSKENIQIWWQTQGQNWIEQLRLLAIAYRQIGHDWQLSPQQQKLWQKYYDANLFLVECLHSDCQVSAEVKKEIEENILLPKEMS